MKLLDVLRRGMNITVLFKQKSKEIEGEFLGRLVLVLKVMMLKSLEQQSTSNKIITL